MLWVAGLLCMISVDRPASVGTTDPTTPAVWKTHQCQVSLLARSSWALPSVPDALWCLLPLACDYFFHGTWAIFLRCLQIQTKLSEFSLGYHETPLDLTSMMPLWWASLAGCDVEGFVSVCFMWTPAHTNWIRDLYFLQVFGPRQLSDRLSCLLQQVAVWLVQWLVHFKSCHTGCECYFPTCGQSSLELPGKIPYPG